MNLALQPRGAQNRKAISSDEGERPLAGKRDFLVVNSPFNTDFVDGRSRGNIRRGAIGFCELKFHAAVDSPEMHRLYKLAEELGVPVLLYFEHEMYNTGIERFEAVLKAYPKIKFIGHAQTWWGNISAELAPQDMYPKGGVKPGGLTDRLLADYSNIYGDLSANSGLNALTRDPEFFRGFLERHTRKLIWGSDCARRDGKGGATPSGYCIAQRCLDVLRSLVPDQTSPTHPLRQWRRLVAPQAPLTCSCLTAEDKRGPVTAIAEVEVR